MCKESLLTQTHPLRSGPSNTYPQRAYRNPLDQVVKFLDSKHGDDWAIWEFRAEGTGYPDEAVYGRVRHYPWPDHHPPPFRLVPMIMASMRNWLNGGELHDGPDGGAAGTGAVTDKEPDAEAIEKKKKNRVVVVHCKAGKGRSGTVCCSYLISEEGWKPQDAMDRFTARRMRPQFGAGVSIPSQVRWLGYIDRWTRGGKKYLDRPIEIVEIHIWGLRNGVKCDVSGYVDEGKKIHIYHTFKKEERHVVEGDAPEGLGLSDIVWELAGYGSKTADDEADDKKEGEAEEGNAPGDAPEKKHSLKKRSTLINTASAAGAHKFDKIKHKASAKFTSSEPPYDNKSHHSSEEEEPGGKAVILKPEQPILVPGSDINIAFELRNRVQKTFGVTMVTAVGHVWFNPYFEGNGPEQESKPDGTGVFSIEWAAMDGIKGTSRKGSRALDRMAVVWRAAPSGEDGVEAGELVEEPEEGKPVPQMKAADWQGGDADGADPQGKTLGLRPQRPDSADVSQASSVASFLMGSAAKAVDKEEAEKNEAIEGVKRSGPDGERWSDDDESKAGKGTL